MQLKRTPIRFKGETVDPDELEKEFDNLYKQLNNMLNASATTSLQLKVTDTGGDVKTIIIETNDYGIVKKANIKG